jgi:hypothetical protein
MRGTPLTRPLVIGTTYILCAHRKFCIKMAGIRPHRPCYHHTRSICTSRIHPCALHRVLQAPASARTHRKLAYMRWQCRPGAPIYLGLKVNDRHASGRQPTLVSMYSAVSCACIGDGPRAGSYEYMHQVGACSLQAPTQINVLTYHTYHSNNCVLSLLQC